MDVLLCGSCVSVRTGRFDEDLMFTVAQTK